MAIDSLDVILIACMFKDMSFKKSSFEQEFLYLPESFAYDTWGLIP